MSLAWGVPSKNYQMAPVRNGVGKRLKELEPDRKASVLLNKKKRRKPFSEQW